MSDNKEENKINFTENDENVENISTTVSYSQKLENEAIKLTEEILNDPFDEFDSISYLKEFYPNLNSEFALRAMQIIEETEKVEEEKILIDIRIVKELLKKENINFGEKALESLENCCINDFLLRKAVPEILKDRPEDHLKILDVGGGPTIYQHIPLMGIADSIIHSEYLKSNRDEIKNWKDGKSEFSWESFFVTYQEYLKNHNNIASSANEEVRNRFREIASGGINVLEDKLREKIVNILACDVSKKDLGMGSIEETYDLVNVGREGSVELITSNFCIESIKDSQEFWQTGMENIASRVPKDGFLLMTAIRNASWYKVGDERMPAFAVNAESISEKLRKEGFEIKIISELVGSEKDVVGYDGMVFVLAKRA